MLDKWTVVGLSGVTCGGKTTVVKALQKKYPECVVLHQDEYFLPEDDPRHIKLPALNCCNWEVMSSLDMDKMRKDIKDVLERPVTTNKNILLVEGFLVLNDEFISKICDKKLFFTLPYEESKRRRETRIYIPADVPGYFDAIVWSEYLKSREEAIKLNPDMEFVDGLRDTDSIISDIVKFFQ